MVFRYHHRPEVVGRRPELVDGPLVETARFWEFAIDEDERWSRGMMDGPGVLAAAVVSAFTAAELTIADPDTLWPRHQAPAIFPWWYPLQQPRRTEG